MPGFRRQLTILLAFVISVTGPRLIAPSCAGSSCPCPVHLTAPAQGENVVREAATGSCAAAGCCEEPAMPDPADSADPAGTDDDRAPVDCHCPLCLVCAFKVPMISERPALMPIAAAPLRGAPSVAAPPARHAFSIFHPPRAA